MHSFIKGYILRNNFRIFPVHSWSALLKVTVSWFHKGRLHSFRFHFILIDRLLIQLDIVQNLLEWSGCSRVQRTGIFFFKWKGKKNKCFLMVIELGIFFGNSCLIFMLWACHIWNCWKTLFFMENLKRVSFLQSKPFCGVGHNYKSESDTVVKSWMEGKRGSLGGIKRHPTLQSVPWRKHLRSNP